MFDDIIQTIREKAQRCRENLPRWFIALTVILSLIVAPAAAQTIEQEWSDDFEDGDGEGWDGEQIQIDSYSVEGNHSLYQPSGYSDTSADAARFTDGPILALDEPFEVNGVVDSVQQEEGARTRIGLINDNDNGAMIVFSSEYGATFLADTGGEDPEGQDQIETVFNDPYVHFRIVSDGEGTLQAKVWEYGTDEPDEWQLEREFDEDVSAPFTFNPGTGPVQREMYLDSVNITGTEATDPRLSLDAENYQQHGTAQPYEVRYELNTTGVANETVDVTDNATVESLNTSVVTVNETSNELVATENTEINRRAIIRAEYNGSIAYHEVTVATPTVDNLEVLPPMWRFSATFGNSTIQAILVALFAGVFGARFSTAFGGLALMQMVMVAGWFTGYATVGITMISLFVSLFVGLNMAANIDYTVRRG